MPAIAADCLACRNVVSGATLRMFRVETMRQIPGLITPQIISPDAPKMRTHRQPDQRHDPKKLIPARIATAQFSRRIAFCIQPPAELMQIR
jgi:hypothetical protein